MKTKHIVKFILTSCLLAGCDINPGQNPGIVEVSQEVKDARSNAIKTLSAYVNLSFYRDPQKEEIRNLISEGTNKINSKTTVMDVYDVLAEYQDKILEVKTNAQLTDEENSPDYQLRTEKSDSIYILNNYIKLEKYREAEQTIITNYIAEATVAINAATSITEVQQILNTYLGYIMNQKTDEKYKQEALASCVSTEQIEEYKKLGYHPIYEDNNYLDGYIVGKTYQKAGENPHHEEYLKTYQNDNKPAWTIAQWSSKYDIMGTGENDGYTLSQDIDGVVNTYTSKGKEVDGKFVPAKVITANSKTGELYLEVNTSVEYDAPRTGSEGWVHLLYSQDFGSRHGDAGLTHIADCSSIVMDAEFTIHKCENKTGPAYNTNRHAAQLVWYVTVQNRNRKSKDYGKYIWFGIGLWDNRSVGKAGGWYRAHDAGTDTLIYNPPTSEYYKETNGVQPGVGVRTHAHVDIKPMIEEAMNYAKDHGYLGTTTYDDLYFGGTNFGYEVPGIFDISSTIHKINVFAK